MTEQAPKTAETIDPAPAAHEQIALMGSVREVKKFRNRRLYDTVEHRYVTLDDVHLLVLDRIPFAIRHANSGKDVTCEVLLDVIVAQAAKEGTELPISVALCAEILRCKPARCQKTHDAMLAAARAVKLGRSQEPVRVIGAETG